MAPKPTCSAYKCRFHLGIGLGTLLRKKLENSAEFEEDFEDFAARPGALDEMGIGRIRDTIADRAPTSLRNCRRRCCRCSR